MTVTVAPESTPQRPHPAWVPWLAAVLGLALAYFLGGKIGLLLAGVNASATAVWPPTGIAIAALLIGGRRWWPGVFIGAFVTNITTAGTVATSLGIATGNTLEALVAATLVIRFANGRAAFDRAVDVVKYAALAGVLSTAISATIGVMTLYLGGLADAASLPIVWTTWWLGDLEGALLIAPVILIWTRPDGTKWTRELFLEALAFAGVAIAVAYALFSPYSVLGAAALPLAFLMLPLVMWPAIRFGPHATASSIIILAAISLGGTIAGAGPFQDAEPDERLLLLQAFLATVSLVGIGLATNVAERHATERALRVAQRDLERRVEERTTSLSQAVNALEREAAERETVHAELHLREQQLLMAHEMAQLGSWQWDYTTNEVNWSPELFALLGLDPEKESPSFARYMALVHPDDLARVETISNEAMATRSPLQIEYRIVRDDGATRHVRVWGYLPHGGSQQGDRYAGVIQDVTDQVNVARAATEASAREMELQRLQEADKFRSQLLGAVSHELKTPLTPLKLQLHMLGRGLFGTLNERQSKAVSILERNLSRLALLVDQTVDIARIEGGRLVLDRKPIDISTVVNDTLEVYEEAARTASVRLMSEIEPDLRADADPNRLAQVLFNLLSNAMKFSVAGGTIRVVARAEDDRIMVEVCDTGAGIDPSEMPRLFGAFNQLSDGGDARHGGTGLGLFISRGIVEAHGGTIVGESAGKGHGTRFRFWIPQTPEA